MLRGVDVSSWQPIIDWQAVALRHEFAIVKCAGGTTYRNPEYADQIAGARGAGLVVGHYHYAFEKTLHPFPGAGPEAEAAFFLANADIRPGELVALDFEEIGAPGDLAAWALAWLRYAEAALGVRPLFYSFPNYIEVHGLGTPALAAYPLWYARYPNLYDPARWPAVPGAWDHLTIWQWSGGTAIAGIPVATDANVFAGDRAALVALGKPDPANPQPDPVEAERAALLDYGAALPFEARGNLTREGVADLTTYGGSASERIAVYERLVAHRLHGSNAVLLLSLWDALRAEGRVTLFG